MGKIAGTEDASGEARAMGIEGWRRGVAIALLATGTAGAVSAEEAPYRPIPVVVGAAATPPNDLAIAARVLRDAAASRNVEGVGAMLVARPLLVSSGITVDTPRTVERKGPYRSARAALADLGAAFREGDVLAPGAGLDLSELDLDGLLTMIVAAVDEAEWGRDPLVEGAVCTYRGGRWKPASAEGVAGSMGYRVDAPTGVRRSADPGARTVATLKPGFLYLQGFVDDTVEGWRPIRLPTGGVGVVAEGELRAAGARGLCFTEVAPGDWRVSAFSAVGL